MNKKKTGIKLTVFVTTIMLIAMLIPSTAFAATNNDKGKIKLNKTKASVVKGKTIKLKASFTPKKPKATKVKWSSSNKKIATVNSKGKVTAKKTGTVTISVKAKNYKTAKCKVTVKKGGAFSVASSGISKGVIAKKYGMYGSQQSSGIPTLSIPIKIKNPPKGTKCYAVYMYDPDASNFIHWMAANISSPTITENASIKKASSMIQGKNDFWTNGYGGPTPPDKTHNYNITVYALSSKVNLSNGFTKSEFDKELKGKVIAKKTIKGKYVK